MSPCTRVRRYAGAPEPAPLSAPGSRRWRRGGGSRCGRPRNGAPATGRSAHSAPTTDRCGGRAATRSEERRVGEEWRPGGAEEQETKRRNEQRTKGIDETL